MARAPLAAEIEALPEADRLDDFPHPRETRGLFGQDVAQATLSEALASGRMHHAWLLSGPAGIGKATLAYQFARAALARPEERDLSARWRSNQTRRRIALLRPCQSGTRKLIGESRFSYSGRTREEPSMMHAAARERLGKRPLGHVLAKQSARLTRVRKIVKAIGLGQRFNFGGKWRSRHYLASARRCAVTACQTAVSTLETGRLASISTQRLGSSVAISRKPAQCFVGFDTLGIVARERAAALRSLDAGTGGQIEDQRQIGKSGATV